MKHLFASICVLGAMFLSIGLQAQSVNNGDGGIAISVSDIGGSTCGQANGVAQISVNGTFDAVLLDGENITTPYFATNLKQGDHFVTVKFNGGGCQTSHIFRIENTSGLSASLDNIQQSTCEGGNGSVTININGGSGNYSVNINGNIYNNVKSQLNVNNLVAGNYIATITDGACTEILPFSISNSNANVGVQISADPIACWGNVGEYNVSGVATAAKVTVDGKLIKQDGTYKIAAGVHKVEITAPSGCKSYKVFTIKRTQPLVVSYVSSSGECGSSNFYVDLDVNGGVAPYQITPSKGEIIERGSSYRIKNLPAGTISLTIVDAIGCQQTVNDLIVGRHCLSCDDFAIDKIVTDSTSCNASTASATVRVAGIDASAAVTYKLYKGEMLIDSVIAKQQRVFAGLGAGEYKVVASATKYNGVVNCNAEGEFTISNFGGPVVEITDKTAAGCGKSNGSATINIVGSFTTVSLDGKPIDNNYRATFLKAGKHIVQVLYNNSCEKYYEFEIEGPSPIAADISYVGACENYQVAVNVSGGVAPYTLTTSSGVINKLGDNMFRISGMEMGEIVIGVEDAIGCTYSSRSVVNAPQGCAPLFTSPSNAGSICSGETFSYTPISTAGKNATYRWSRAAVNGILQSAAAGSGNISETLTNITSAPITVVYEYIVESQYFGLPASTYVSVVVNPREQLTLSVDLPIDGRVKLVNALDVKASPADIGKYTFKCNGDVLESDGANAKVYAFAQKPSSNTLTVEATNDYGCVSNATTTFVAEYDAPNIITPYETTNNKLLPGYYIKVFNTQGQMIYSGNTGWDGTYRGGYVAGGTYMYAIEAKAADGTPVEVKFYVYVKY